MTGTPRASRPPPPDIRCPPRSSGRAAGSPGRTRVVGWAAAIGVAVFALLLRVHRLGSPNLVAFDETYYAKDAWSLLHFGYVKEYLKDADGNPKTDINADIIHGHTTGIWDSDPSMVVHPEVGKWLIALGEKAFGMDPFGWRISAAVVGALMVLVMCRLARRLTGSTALGLVAGLLLSFDGLHFVLSRLALLDIFLAFFLLCGVACVVNDRDWHRARLASLVDGPIPARRLGTGASVAVPPVAAARRGLLRPRARHQVDGDLPDGRVRPAGLRLERRRAEVVRRAVGAAAGGARGRRTRLRAAGPGGRLRLHRHLDRLAGARRRLRAGLLPVAVRPVRRRRAELRRRTGPRRQPVADREGARRLRPGRADPVAALALVLPPGRLHVPHALPELQHPPLRVQAVRLAASSTGRSGSPPTPTSSRPTPAATRPRAASATSRCC